MILTSRDIEIIDFLKQYKVATTSTIQRLFFTSRQTAERRLRLLVNNGKIKRDRNDVLSEYYYYINRKPTNLKHTLYISQLFSLVKEQYNVILHKPEYEINWKNNAIRADLLAVLKINGKSIPVIFEIDLNKPYNNKYTDYVNSNYYKFKFPIPPILVSISNRTPKSIIPVKYYSLDILTK